MNSSALSMVSNGEWSIPVECNILVLRRSRIKFVKASERFGDSDSLGWFYGTVIAGMNKRKVGVSLVLLAILIACALLLRSGLGWPWRSQLLSTPTVVTQIRQLNQLATVRFSIQRVVGLTEPKIPVGEESILIIVQGDVQAGVDLVDLRQEDVMLTEKGAVVRLPAPKVLTSYLDESQTRVWDRHVTWWTPWVPFSPDLEHRARLQALDEIRKAAIKMGILDRAAENAENAIRQFLAAFRVQVKFDHQGA